MKSHPMRQPLKLKSLNQCQNEVSDITTLYASICEESSFQLKEIWNVATNDKNKDWDEKVKIMECNKQGDEVIIARMRKTSL